ncbi:histidine kinase [Streptomyces sp. N2-109]|uniref:histidine kinase n=1 Tax=Streptomyces gossypii TaxID=2883101 RepID=A0ABT2JYF3_9ACTN|nr:histidine kinase [Streptomyces gossypii]MCT2592933.1 histidine kinase [Streptomyces gossypii]
MTADAQARSGAEPVQRWPYGDSAVARRIRLSLWRFRDLHARRPWVWDVLLPALLLPAALAEPLGPWQNTAPNPEAPGVMTWLVSAGFLVPLLWRRKAPIFTLWAIALTGVVDGWVGSGMEIGLTRLYITYLIAVRQTSHLGWAAGLGALQSVVLAVRWPDGNFDQTLMSPLMAFAVVILLGVAVRTRRDYTASLVERARQLEIERDQQAQIAAAAERARIAREMHDIIGHNLSVITGLADGGSYVVAKSPARGAQALEAIGTTSRQALGELRRLLGVLHEDAQPQPLRLDPQPALTDLDRLLDGVREAGLPVRCTVRGQVPDLSAGRQLTVYRVVQEALTNILKHSGLDKHSGSNVLADVTADVIVVYGEDGAVEATILDSGRPARGHSPLSRTVSPERRGLNGMRERAALYDGTLEAGPQATGGWRVRLRLPAPAGIGG